MLALTAHDVRGIRHLLEQVVIVEGRQLMLSPTLLSLIIPCAHIHFVFCWIDFLSLLVADSCELLVADVVVLVSVQEFKGQLDVYLRDLDLKSID